MRPQFTEHKVLAAADLEDEREYLDDVFARHLDHVHGTTGSVLVAATVAHPHEQTAIGFGSGPAGTALAVSVAGVDGASSEQVRVTAPAAQSVLSQLVLSRPAAAAASAAAPGTLSLLAGVGNPAATELRVEAPGATGSGPVLECGYGANRLSIEAGRTVVAGDMTVTGKLVMGPAPAPAAPATPDPTGSVAAAEALRQQLAQGLGIGEDVGIAIAIANPVVGGGRVRFSVQVTDVQSVAGVLITIRGRVNVGTATVADVAFNPAQLQGGGQILQRDVDVAIPAGVTGDVIVAVTAFGVQPQVGLVNASEARMLGTVV